MIDGFAGVDCFFSCFLRRAVLRRSRRESYCCLLRWEALPRRWRCIFATKKPAYVLVFCCESELRRNDATSRMAAHLVLRIPQRLYDRNTHLLDIQQWPNQIEDLQVIETADSLLFMFINDCLCFFHPLWKTYPND